MADKDQLEKVRRTINVLADMDCSDREECGATTDRVIEYLRELATEMKAEIDAFDEAVAAGPLSEPIGSTDHLDAVTTASITYRVSIALDINALADEVIVREGGSRALFGLSEAQGVRMVRDRLTDAVNAVLEGGWLVQVPEGWRRSVEGDPR